MLAFLFLNLLLNIVKLIESCATKTSKDTDSSNTPSTSIATTSTCSATISDEIKSIANNLQEISDKKTEVISRNLDSKNVPDISDIRSDLVPEEMLKLLGLAGLKFQFYRKFSVDGLGGYPLFFDT